MPRAQELHYRFNVKDPVYCIMQSDTDAGTTYGEVKSAGEAMQVQLTAEVAKGELYGNGRKASAQSKLMGLTLACDITKIPFAVATEMQGHNIQDGVGISSADDEAPYLAFGYIIEDTEGKNEYTWLLKGKVQPINETAQQSTGSINYSTQTLTIDFVPRKSDGNLKFYADASEAAFTVEQAEKWFAAGPTSIPVPDPAI